LGISLHPFSCFLFPLSFFLSFIIPAIVVYFFGWPAHDLRLISWLVNGQALTIHHFQLPQNKT
jgi:hypothetical protein